MVDDSVEPCYICLEPVLATSATSGLVGVHCATCPYAAHYMCLAMEMIKGRGRFRCPSGHDLIPGTEPAPDAPKSDDDDDDDLESDSSSESSEFEDEVFTEDIHPARESSYWAIASFIAWVFVLILIAWNIANLFSLIPSHWEPRSTDVPQTGNVNMKPVVSGVLPVDHAGTGKTEGRLYDWIHGPSLRVIEGYADTGAITPESGREKTTEGRISSFTSPTLRVLDTRWVRVSGAYMHVEDDHKKEI